MPSWIKLFGGFFGNTWSGFTNKFNDLANYFSRGPIMQEEIARLQEIDSELQIAEKSYSNSSIVNAADHIDLINQIQQLAVEKIGILKTFSDAKKLLY